MGDTLYVCDVTKDCLLLSDIPGGSFTDLGVGEDNAASNRIRRGLVQFDLSGYPEGLDLTSVVLRLYYQADKSDKETTLYVYRLKKDWEVGEANWTRAKSGSDWQTAGAAGSEDRDTDAIGSYTLPASPSLGTYIDITLDSDSIQEWLDGEHDNYGLFLKTSIEDADGYVFYWLELAPSANHPTLRLTTSEWVSAPAALSMDATLEGVSTPAALSMDAALEGVSTPAALSMDALLTRGVVINATLEGVSSPAALSMDAALAGVYTPAAPSMDATLEGVSTPAALSMDAALEGSKVCDGELLTAEADFTPFGNAQGQYVGSTQTPWQGWSSSPRCAFRDASGYLHVFFSEGEDTAWYSSVDSGENWSETETIDPPAAYTGTCTEVCAPCLLDNGHIVLLRRYKTTTYPDGALYENEWDGDSWGGWTCIDSTRGWYFAACSGPNNTLVVLNQCYGSSSYTLYCATRSAAGEWGSWELVSLPEEDLASSSSPCSVCVDANGDSWFLYCEKGSADTYAHVTVRGLVDGSLADAVNLSQLVETEREAYTQAYDAAGYQNWWILASRTGEVYVAFYPHYNYGGRDSWRVLAVYKEGVWSIASVLTQTDRYGTAHMAMSLDYDGRVWLTCPADDDRFAAWYWDPGDGDSWTLVTDPVYLSYPKLHTAKSLYNLWPDYTYNWYAGTSYLAKQSEWNGMRYLASEELLTYAEQHDPPVYADAAIQKVWTPAAPSVDATLEGVQVADGEWVTAEAEFSAWAQASPWRGQGRYVGVDDHNDAWGHQVRDCFHDAAGGLNVFVAADANRTPEWWRSTDDGYNWSEQAAPGLPEGYSRAYVGCSACLLTNGHILLAGGFYTDASARVLLVNEWNGASWGGWTAAWETGVIDYWAYTPAVLCSGPNSTAYCMTGFAPTGVNGVVKLSYYNGSTWSALEDVSNTPDVRADSSSLCVDANGDPWLLYHTKGGTDTYKSVYVRGKVNGVWQNAVNLCDLVAAEEQDYTHDADSGYSASWDIRADPSGNVWATFYPEHNWGLYENWRVLVKYNGSEWHVELVYTKTDRYAFTPCSLYLNPEINRVWMQAQAWSGNHWGAIYWDGSGDFVRVTDPKQESYPYLHWTHSFYNLWPSASYNWYSGASFAVRRDTYYGIHYMSTETLVTYVTQHDPPVYADATVTAVIVKAQTCRATKSTGETTVDTVAEDNAMESLCSSRKLVRDTDGLLHFCAVRKSPSATTLELFSSGNDGATWSQHVLCTQGVGDTYQYGSALVALSDEKLLALFCAQLSGDSYTNLYGVYFNGSNWGSPWRVTDDSVNCLYPHAAADASDNVHVIVRHQPSDLYYHKLVPATSTLETSTELTTAEYALGEGPGSICVDSSGNPTAAWSQRSAADGRFTIYLREYSEGSWGSVQEAVQGSWESSLEFSLHDQHAPTVLKTATTLYLVWWGRTAFDSGGRVIYTHRVGETWTLEGRFRGPDVDHPEVTLTYPAVIPTKDGDVIILWSQYDRSDISDGSVCYLVDDGSISYGVLSTQTPRPYGVYVADALFPQVGGYSISRACDGFGVVATLGGGETTYYASSDLRWLGLDPADTDGLTMDANFAAAIQQQLTMDARVFIDYPQDTLTLDAAFIAAALLQGDVPLDALLTGAITAALQADAALSDVLASSVTMDAGVIEGTLHPSSVTADALLTGAVADTMSLDAAFASELSDSLSLDAYFAENKAGSISAKALLAGDVAYSVPLAALFRGAVLKAISLGARFTSGISDVPGSVSMAAHFSQDVLGSVSMAAHFSQDVLGSVSMAAYLAEVSTSHKGSPVRSLLSRVRRAGR